MAWPRWRHTLNEAKRLAVKAIDEYNCSTGHYGDFVGTMVRAWLYLLQAEFARGKIDYRYKDPEGQPILIDGEPKLWDVLRSAKERFPASNDPVRINLELFIGLRNKVEHRYEVAMKSAAGGRAHALVINFEQELTTQFGAEHSLADQLRFPLFVESITAPDRKDSVKAARALRAAQTVLAKFDADLDSAVLDDQRYDFRVRLVPMLGPKSSADAAVEFVKLDELSDDERKVMVEAGRSGSVITKVKKVPVSAAGFMLPKGIVAAVQARVPYNFTLSDHTRLWQHFKLHDKGWTAPDGGETVAQYCVPNEPTKQYVFTAAWVDRILKEVGTSEQLRSLLRAPATPREGNADRRGTIEARAGEFSRGGEGRQLATGQSVGRSPARLSAEPEPPLASASASSGGCCGPAGGSRATPGNAVRPTEPAGAPHRVPSSPADQRPSVGQPTSPLGVQYGEAAPSRVMCAVGSEAVAGSTG